MRYGQKGGAQRFFIERKNIKAFEVQIVRCVVLWFILIVNPVFVIGKTQVRARPHL